jgi:octaprenyl-diphosphate synthase
MDLQAHRTLPAGLHAGAPLTTVAPVSRGFELMAPELVAVERTLGELLHSSVPAVERISRYLVEAGGKRLRPLLTGLCARAAGHDGPLPRLMCVGELMHLGSLLHDDVVDDGMERRGRKTAHRVYGNPGVILTGDFCLARSMWLAAQEGGFTAVSELGHTATLMAEGEVLQLLNAGNLDLDLPTYIEILDKKSAALIAFQITDDVLDYVGDQRATGKRIGADLAEGKMTLPLIFAMERVPGLRETLAQGPLPAAVQPEVLAAVRSSGAPEDALAEARSRVEAALASLDAARLPDTPWRDAVVGLAHHLVERAA